MGAVLCGLDVVGAVLLAEDVLADALVLEEEVEVATL